MRKAVEARGEPEIVTPQIGSRESWEPRLGLPDFRIACHADYSALTIIDTRFENGG
jgi:hypothetical protein